MSKKNDNKSQNIAKRAQIARRKLDQNEKKVSRHTQNFFHDRIDNLRLIRKNVIFWLTAISVLMIFSIIQVVFLQENLKVESSANGGTYAEGVVDKITTLNPIFATTENEIAASKLLYLSMFSYDETNNLKGRLVSSWSTENGKVWNFKLRENMSWSDGEKITADDIIFTMNLIKDPAVESPLYSTFLRTEITKISDYEVQFDLSTAYMSLPYSLMFGVLPEHAINNLDPSEIRNFMATEFSKDVVSGPFNYLSNENVNTDQMIWRFSRNEKYVPTSRVASLTIRTYASEENMLNGLNTSEINAAVGVSAKSASEMKVGQKLSQSTINDGVFVLFNTSTAILENREMREVLRLATDRDKLRKSVVHDGLDDVLALDSPIATDVYASVDALKQPDLDVKSAEDKLSSMGWNKNDKTGFREKDGNKLTLNVVTIADTDYAYAARELVKQWQSIGIDANLTEADPSIANDSYLSTRDYDVLVYDLHLGADPDEFAYWSSTEIDSNGLNFANYRNKRADLLLNAGRTQSNPEARESRYIDFVKRWQADIPAIALYQPKMYFLTKESVNGLKSEALVHSGARFRNVSDWSVLTKQVKVTQ